MIFSLKLFSKAHMDEDIEPDEGYALMDAPSISEDVVLEELSTEADYTVYEYRFLPTFGGNF